jgi:hypothetical protein
MAKEKRRWWDGRKPSKYIVAPCAAHFDCFIPPPPSRLLLILLATIIMWFFGELDLVKNLAESIRSRIK